MSLKRMLWNHYFEVLKHVSFIIVCLSVCLSICLSIYPSVSVCLCVCLSASLSLSPKASKTNKQKLFKAYFVQRLYWPDELEEIAVSFISGAVRLVKDIKYYGVVVAILSREFHSDCRV